MNTSSFTVTEHRRRGLKLLEESMTLLQSVRNDGMSDSEKLEALRLMSKLDEEAFKEIVKADELESKLIRLQSEKARELISPVSNF